MVVVKRPAEDKIFEILKDEKILKLGIEDRNITLSAYNGYLKKFKKYKIYIFRREFYKNQNGKNRYRN